MGAVPRRSPGAGWWAVAIQHLGRVGDLLTAEAACATALARCREYGDLHSLPDLLTLMADLDIQAGCIHDAATHLREGLQAAGRAGKWFEVLNGLDSCATLRTATGRYAEATLGAALDAHPVGERGPRHADRRKRRPRTGRRWDRPGRGRPRSAERRSAWTPRPSTPACSPRTPAHRTADRNCSAS
jgi:hypothetical protein